MRLCEDSGLKLCDIVQIDVSLKFKCQLRFCKSQGCLGRGHVAKILKSHASDILLAFD